MQDSQSLEQAKSFFLSGLEKLNSNNLTGAEIDFQSSLKLVPNRLSTLINLSIVLIKLNKFENAEKLINEGLIHYPKNKELLMGLVEIYEKLINHKPDYVEAHVNLGNVYRELNMYEESVAAYNAAIIIKPDLGEVYSNRGNIFTNPKSDLADTYLERGNILRDLKLIDKALASYERAIQINSNYAEAHSNRGIALRELKRLEEAIVSYDRAIEINPDLAEAYLNRGIALRELKLFDEALASYDRAIELDPNLSEAYSNRGNALKDLNRLDEALVSYAKAIDINPNNAEAYSNLGYALQYLNRLDDALASFNQAIEINPDYAQAYSNRGIALQELKRTDEAINYFDKAISLEPQYAEASHNKSLILLMKGEFKKGWELYKWRWRIRASSTERFHTKIAHWDGINTDKSLKIFLWAEQGIGDEIFYFGMLKNFSNITSKVIATADNRLHGIFKRSMPEVEFIDRKKIDIEFIESSVDYQAPMGDLGYLCSVDKVIDTSRPKPFLSVNSLCMYDIEINNILTGNILCGLSWKSANKDIGLSKSLNLIDLAPLLLIENLEFVSLQYGSTKDEIDFIEKSIGKKIHTVDGLDLYNDIDGLVALIDRCDFVVTTSNVTAHLTGSIGKKGIVLLPFSKGKIWYWHSGIGQSLWYPSLEMVSQLHMNDWTDPIQKCKEWILDQI